LILVFLSVNLQLLAGGKTVIDSLLVESPQEQITCLPSLPSFPATKAAPHAIHWNTTKILGMAMMGIFGGLTYYFHQEAEEAYAAYLKSGKISEIDRLYDRAIRYDRYKGWTYAGMELGFFITVLSFDLELP
jgi:hypothetical protein